MSRYGVGVDIGGTTCKIGLFKEDGTLLHQWEIPTDVTNDGENILKDVAMAVEAERKDREILKKDIIGIGMGVPGPVEADGIVNGCVNLGWGKRNICKEMESLTGYRIEVGNDANVAALGELRYGCGIGCESLLLVTIGTGVGGGIAFDRGIWYGATGAAGEIGHMTVNSVETERCGCGRKGCLEQYVSATGMKKTAQRVLTETTKKSILNIDNINVKAIYDAAKEGDEVALELVEQMAQILGKALGNVAVVINPQCIVLGGGVSKAGEFLLKKVVSYYKEYAFHACKDTAIVLATLGNDAGIYGGMAMLTEQN